MDAAFDALIVSSKTVFVSRKIRVESRGLGAPNCARIAPFNESVGKAVGTKAPCL